MAQVIKSLNLNKTPQLVQPNSLVYAKNVQVDKRNIICKDNGVIEIFTPTQEYKLENKRILGQIVGLNSKIYFFVEENLNNNDIDIPIDNPQYVDQSNIDTNDDVATIQKEYNIYEYNEEGNWYSKIMCNWSYNGGKITGVVTLNSTNEEILTICEYFENKNDIKVPIKHINLSHCSKDDDESLYTSNPNIPITNLNLIDTYVETIPNGVYQFFIRYKIRDNFYTNWFPCSKECFAGTSIKTDTIQGSVKYVDIRKDAGKSFIFNVEYLNQEFINNYQSFQLGFIVSNDDTSVARSWKHFEFSTTKIYFTYLENDITEINIDDLTSATYDIHNVENIAYFKNKLYISNYEESDFNPKLQTVADKVTVTTDSKLIKVLNSESNTVLGNKILSKSENDLTYYDVWGGSDIKNICDNRDLFNITSNKDQASDSDDINYITLNTYINSDNERKFYFIRSIETDVKQKGDISVPKEYTKYKDTTDYPDLKDLMSFTWNDHLKGHICYDKSSNIINQLFGNEAFGNRWYFYKEYGPNAEFKTNVSNPFYLSTSNTTPSVLKTQIADCDTQFKDRLKGIVEEGSIFSNLYINYISVQIDNEEIILLGEKEKDPKEFSGIPINSEDDVTTKIYELIKDKLVGITADANHRPIIKIDNNNKELDNIKVVYTKLKHDVSIDSIDTWEHKIIDTVIKEVYSVDYINISLKVEDKESNDIKFEQHTTLLPFVNYDFYIHFVKNNGVTTNGYYIGSSYINKDDSEPNYIYKFFPVFNHIEIPNGYSSYFITCFVKNHKIAQGFHLTFENNGDNNYTYYLDCLECDTILFNGINNITIISADDTDGCIITKKAKYHPSGTTNPLSLFGNVGVLTWSTKDLEKNVTHDFITNTGDQSCFYVEANRESYDEIKEYNKKLIKITPYIKDNTFSNSEYMNLPGYICQVTKPDRAYNNLYKSGNDVYNKKIDKDTIEIHNTTDYISISKSELYYIKSAYNLNYLSLLEDNYLVPQIRTFDKEINNDSITVKQVTIGFQSLNISDIYELPSMYRDYIRKYYSVYNSNSMTRFDNTIRSSNVEIDEAYRNIFKFNAESYYVVPSNKGKITNLFSIVNSLYIHTQHSLFKFAGNNSMTSEEGDVSLKETDIFETGISEIFDSKNGYAGLKDKKHSIITFNAYIFYDAYAKIIYAYEGDTQLTAISTPVGDVIDKIIVDDIIFASDEHNNKIYININNSICISYNIALKAFISIHDLTFGEAFNSRTHLYFINNDKNKLYQSNTKEKDYGDLYVKSELSCLDDINIPEQISVIDVIFNDNYETIKQLDYINWICSRVLNLDNPDSPNIAEEDLDTNYSGDKIRIYSDQCHTELIDLTDENGVPLVQNDVSILNPNSYKYPRYNCGIWSLNYFRDIKHGNQNIPYQSDNNSLLYGKYFVFRLVFIDKNFKFENIKFNVNNYGKA